MEVSRIEMEVVLRGKRDMKPLLLKLGVAFAISFAGFLVSHFRSRRCFPSSKPSSGSGCESGGKGLKDELRILKTEEPLAKIINGTTTTTTITTTTTTVVGLSPTSRSSGDKEGFLLPEFNDLVQKEFEATDRRSPEPTTPTNQTPKKSDNSKEDNSMEQEVANLKNLIWSLREREQNLEFQLLEYYGYQEQEAAMRELESRLKINTVEAELFSLKNKSLQAENQRLQAQLFDCSKAGNELEAARAKIKSLKRKLKLEGEQAMEKMATLHQRIALLERREEMIGRENADIERKLRRLKDLENESAKLRMVNSSLVQENEELSQKMEASVLKKPEAQALEQAKQLREANDKLTKEIEQLQTDRCADVEELVYLRWVNACLRYELRNYQAPPGKTVARDLSKTLSPKSEEKAKQLILEYANSGFDEKGLSPMDFDTEYSSSSQASTGEPEDIAIELSSTMINHSSKSKFFSKLKKLVLRKDTNGSRPSSAERTPTNSAHSERRVSFSTSYVDDMIGRDSYDSLSSCMTEDLAPGDQLSGMEAQVDHRTRLNKHAESQGRSSLDMQRIRGINLEEGREGKDENNKRAMVRSLSYKRIAAGEVTGLGLSSPTDSEESEARVKAELKKYAEALKRSRGINTTKKRSSVFRN